MNLFAKKREQAMNAPIKPGSISHHRLLSKDLAGGELTHESGNRFTPTVESADLGFDVRKFKPLTSGESAGLWALSDTVSQADAKALTLNTSVATWEVADLTPTLTLTPAEHIENEMLRFRMGFSVETSTPGRALDLRVLTGAGAAEADVLGGFQVDCHGGVKNCLIDVLYTMENLGGDAFAIKVHDHQVTAEESYGALPELSIKSFGGHLSALTGPQTAHFKVAGKASDLGAETVTVTTHFAEIDTAKNMQVA